VKNDCVAASDASHQLLGYLAGFHVSRCASKCTTLMA